MGWMLGTFAAAMLVANCAAEAARAAELPANDYPTAARAIASLLPFDEYEEAETVMRVRQRAGKNASMFLSMPMLRAKVDELKRAQVEAELRCF